MPCFGMDFCFNKLHTSFILVMMPSIAFRGFCITSFSIGCLLEAEGYLSDRVVLLLRLRERFVWGGASVRCHCQYGIGVKYIF